MTEAVCGKLLLLLVQGRRDRTSLSKPGPLEEAAATCRSTPSGRPFGPRTPTRPGAAGKLRKLVAQAINERLFQDPLAHLAHLASFWPWQRHLAEFWMIEPELAFADIHDDMNVAEAGQTPSSTLARFSTRRSSQCAAGLPEILRQFCDAEQQTGWGWTGDCFILPVSCG